MPELEPFEEDPFVAEMIDLAMTDEDEAARLVEEADEDGGHGGMMLAEFRRQHNARVVAKDLMFMNSDEGQQLLGRKR